MRLARGQQRQPRRRQSHPQQPRDETDTLASTLRAVKRALVSDASGAQIIEAVPAEPSVEFPVPREDLRMLHRFASANPIYHSSRESVLAGIRCVTYEGNVDRYWLGSILHESSRAPFSPTWIASAYVVARLAKQLGYCQALDVGSGDGRIAFCTALLGMDAYSIEIDADLAGMQERFARIAGFKLYCSDADAFDYGALGLARPMIFVGGLAQMGGAALAESVMRGLADTPCADAPAGWAFAGTMSPKYTLHPKGMHGWGGVMYGAGLRHVRTVDLPTAWTLEQEDDTPYVFARPS